MVGVEIANLMEWQAIKSTLQGIIRLVGELLFQQRTTSEQALSVTVGRRGNIDISQHGTISEGRIAD